MIEEGEFTRGGYAMYLSYPEMDVTCPECGQLTEKAGGCTQCPACGWSKCG